MPLPRLHLVKNLHSWQILALALILPWLLLHSSYFPFLGFTLAGLWVATQTLSWKSERHWLTIFWYLSLIALSLMFLFRTDELYLVFTSLLYVYVWSWLILENGQNLTLITLISAPILALHRFTQTKPGGCPFPLTLHPSHSQPQTNKTPKNHSPNPLISELKSLNWPQILISLALTFFLLLLIIPFLNQANPYFQQIFGNFWESFASLIYNSSQSLNHLLLDLLRWLSHFSPDHLLLARLILTISFWFGFRQLAHFLHTSTPLSEDKDSPYLTVKTTSPSWREKIMWNLPKSVVITLLTVFLITQARLYLASQAELQEMNFTLSDLTNQVFFHLSFVSAIVINLIFWDPKRLWLNLSLGFLLGLQGILLTLAAADSVYQYIYEWGLTFKRLYGIIVVITVLGGYASLAWFFWRHQPESKFFRNGLIWLTLIWIIIGFSNFDWLIFQYNSRYLPTDHNPYAYLDELSVESGGWIKTWQTQERRIQNLSQSPSITTNPVFTPDTEDSSRTQSQSNLDRLQEENQELEKKLLILQNKYSTGTTTSFNLSQYLTYVEAKNQNIYQTLNNSSN